jgi:hypothetical protein
MGLLMRCGIWQVPQPINRPIPTGQNEATSHYWNKKIPLEKESPHHSVDICEQNALKPTSEFVCLSACLSVWLAQLV